MSGAKKRPWSVLCQVSVSPSVAPMPELLAKEYVPVPLKASTKRPFHREWTETYCEGPFPTPEILLERLRQYLFPGNEVANPAYSTKHGAYWEVGIVARNRVAFIDVDGEVTAIDAITGLNQQTTTVKCGTLSLGTARPPASRPTPGGVPGQAGRPAGPLWPQTQACSTS